MKCPFCSDSIHPNAKYCPKCGLPIKDEPTVMGAAFVPDEAGPNPWMLASGGLAALALIFGIGWASSQIGRSPNQTAATTRTIAAYRTPATGTNTLTATPVGGATGASTGAWGASNRPGSYVASPAPAPAPVTPPPSTAQWAFTSPTRTANAGFFPGFVWPDPLPPAVPLLEIGKAGRNRESTVTVVTPQVPEVPEDAGAQMAYASPSNTEGGRILQGASMPGVFANGTPLYGQPTSATQSATPTAAVPESRRSWVWDPVHEAWARNSDYNGNRQRRVIRNTGNYR
jgi:hypothetical protein